MTKILTHMSKQITANSLTSLRNQLNNIEDENNAKELYLSGTFPIDELEIVDVNYPLIMNKEELKCALKSEMDEFSLAKIIHESLRLTKQQASNNLYWTYLNLTLFYERLRDDTLNQIEGKSVENISQILIKNILIVKPSQNHLITSQFAGLWWAIEMTKDTSRSDEYYYSKLFLEDMNLRKKNMGTYLMNRDKEVLFGLLDFYKKYKDSKLENGTRIGSEAIAQQSSKTLNQLGGLILLSYLNKHEILKLLETHRKTILNRAIHVKKGKITSRKKIQQKHNYIYFHLNYKNGHFKLSKKEDTGWDRVIAIDSNVEDQFLVHFYKEGKIKLSYIKGLLSKKLDKKYKNGFNTNQDLFDVKLINEPVLFAMCYRNEHKSYFKAYDKEDNSLFKANDNLSQNGKKLLYNHNVSKIKFCILPYTLKDSLDKVIYNSPTAKGADLSSSYYNKEWELINEYCPDILNIKGNN